MDFLKSGTFTLGCNYWASHAGTNMWRDWDESIVDNDLKRLKDTGIEAIRVFPLWPDFQQLNWLYGGCGYPVEIAGGERFLDDRDAEDSAGMNKQAMEHFERLCKLADKYGLKMIVALITGWMSGRLYVPRLLEGRDVITDPLAIKYEIKFIECFINRFKKENCIAAWEFGNECNAMGGGDREQHWLWSKALSDAARLCDPDRPFYSGMHSLGLDKAWHIEDQGEICDMLTVHPYAVFTPHCDNAPLTSMRTTLHGAAELTMYSGLGGKPCFVEETGSLGTVMGNDEMIGRFAFACMFSAFAQDGRGYFWWCANDQLHLNHAPYDWCDVEKELGILRIDGSVKPVGYAIKRFKEFKDSLPFPLPKRKVDAVCLLNPGADPWGMAYASFLLGKQASLNIEFASVERTLPDSDIYIIPSAPKGPNMLRNRIYHPLMERVQNGATLYISYDGATFSPFEEITGCKSNGKYITEDNKIDLFGDIFEIARNYIVDLTADRAQTVAVDGMGRPAMTLYKKGKGNIIFLNAPLEKYMLQGTDKFAEDKPDYYKFYSYIKQVASVKEKVTKTSKMLAVTEHALGDGTTVVIAVNHSQKNISESFRFNGAKLDRVIYGDVTENKAVIPSQDAVCFTVKDI